jgi:hypothetical protein
MRIVWLSILLCAAIAAQGQSYDPLHPPNSYNTASNPNYWKNKMPYEGYWQQDVHYTIKALIDEKTDIISGKQELVYTNNSPDELNFVYFHLYQEAFQPGSHYDKLLEASDDQPKYGKYEKQGFGTEIKKLLVNGTEAKTEQDNTILKVYLSTPLKSGESVTFNIDFETYFGPYSGYGSGVERRMKKFNSWKMDLKHYDGVLWYPRISVYDKKFGWTTDQHLTQEFYGDFGTFDVELDFASNFVVDATGFLQNRSEVLPDDLRKKLDIKNFTSRVRADSVSIITPYDSTQRKTWKYHAENVHDFAFTADPSYRIGEAEWNGIKCIALAQERNAYKWQNAADYSAKVIQVYSEDIGMYVYHKIIVADARDGMEYPMLTLDGGGDPSYRSLLAHEIGHNWFYGQVGTNETYRAFMDEGFTQFLTAWSMVKIDGDTVVRRKGTFFPKFYERFERPVLAIDNEVYSDYLYTAVRNADPALNTHSDDFSNEHGYGGGYGQVYNKTAVMLYNLQYVLGDELFLKAMQHYFATWKIAHPYPEDFRNAIIQYTKVDLNWFFDQWLETSKRIDYAIKTVKYGETADQYVVSFKRIGDMQMPLDFTVHSNDGKSHHFYIPNTWFEKETDATVLPRWTGWGELAPTYEAKITVPGGIKNVVIDTTRRLADINMLNNSSSLPITYTLDSRIYNDSDPYNYELFARPDVWYNGYDGIKAGVHLNGNYMNYKHIFALNVWFNTGIAQRLPDAVTESNFDNVNNEFDDLSFRFNYMNHLSKLGRGIRVRLGAKMLDGLGHYRLGLEKDSKHGLKFYSYFNSLYRKDSISLNYLIHSDEWTPAAWNNTINVGVEKRYGYKRGYGHIKLHLRSSALGGDYDYSQLSLSVVNRNYLGPLKLNTRTFVQYGTGNALPKESSLFLAGANPEEMMDNKYTRSLGFLDYNWQGYGSNTNNFHHGGGLNLRGYSGYLAPELDGNDSIRYSYRGNSGAAVNVELEFQDLIPISFYNLSQSFGLKMYLFGDAGIVAINGNNEKLELADIRADAGVGAALTINYWGPFEKVKPLTIRFDMPLLLNRIPALESDYFAPRWIIGVNRAF